MYENSLGPSRHVNGFATAIASNPRTEDINRAISFLKTANVIHLTTFRIILQWRELRHSVLRIINLGP